jgi:hypothetical protein
LAVDKNFIHKKKAFYINYPKLKIITLITK